MKKIGPEESVERMVSKALENVFDGSTIGLGSGTTAARFVRALGVEVKKKRLNVSVIPSSLQIQALAEEVGLRVTTLGSSPEIQAVFDGADQVDSSFRLLKGYGGALLREKILMMISKKRIILADEKKFVAKLDKPVPVEVLPFGRVVVAEELKKLGGNPRLRLLDKGYPFITEQGNLIFHVEFGPLDNPHKLEKAVKTIPGVIEVGIFTIPLDLVYRAKSDGEVDILRP